MKLTIRNDSGGLHRLPSDGRTLVLSGDREELLMLVAELIGQIREDEKSFFGRQFGAATVYSVETTDACLQGFNYLSFKRVKKGKS